MVIEKIGFTSGRISTLVCKAGQDQTMYRDAKTPCLGLRITKSGVKSFIFETWFNGKSLRSTIGDTSTWSIAQAQTEARRLKVLTDQGIDPRETKKQEKVLHRARNTKSIAGLIVWQEYINDRKVNWGERHLKDHYDMVRDGGEPIKRGLRKKQAPVKKLEYCNHCYRYR
jgi:hypothetical protein